MQAPILYIFFNRPDCVERSFAAVRAARPGRLYLVTDGPRDHVPGDAAGCAQARAVIARMLDWPCDVHRDFSERNLGPTRRIESALNWIFRHEETAVILEDDCVADAAFFPFCDDLLERYREEPRVGMISGCQFAPGGWPSDDSYRFVHLAQIWGWATWRRAWTRHDPAMTRWPAARREGLLRRVFPDYAPHRRYWRRRFDACHKGQLDVWDYRWVFSRWDRGQLGIVPVKNLVSYIGFRDDALHTRGPHPAANLPSSPLARPLRHPRVIAADEELDDVTARLLFYEGGYFPWIEYQWKKRFAHR